MMSYRMIALLMLMTASYPALAESPEDPARQIMEIADARWSDSEFIPAYFSKKTLERDFSRRFVEIYSRASRAAGEDGVQTPLDFDIITGATTDGGCTLADIEVKTETSTESLTTVLARFRASACADEGSPEQQAISQVRFDVIVEDGRPVIADIHRLADGNWDSLVAVLERLAGKAP